ncbi:MAG: type III pantothenate kinase, partial [Clostridia bacterium]|nr:type III pantothenate kinase [Clostridia bacterium]
GTATTFDVVTENCELLGVVIAPGIKTSLEGLATKTAQLPMVELDAPKTVIGKNTKHCMQAGIIFGFAGLVDNILKKIKKELGVKEIKVVATGGLGEIIAKEVKEISTVDRTLTLDGLKTIYELNR